MSTSSILRSIDSMQRRTVSKSIDSHSSLEIAISSSLFDGFLLSTRALGIPQTFSIGFKSGDEAGQGKTSMLLSEKKRFVVFAVCGGALSCWKTNRPMCWRRNQGRKWSPNNPWYPCAFSVPDTANKGLFLDTEMAPQNITFNGNFDLATFGRHPFL